MDEEEKGKRGKEKEELKQRKDEGRRAEESIYESCLLDDCSKR